jgi:hypothetical protein
MAAGLAEEDGKTIGFSVHYRGPPNTRLSCYREKKSRGTSK